MLRGSSAMGLVNESISALGSADTACDETQKKLKSRVKAACNKTTNDVTCVWARDLTRCNDADFCGRSSECGYHSDSFWVHWDSYSCSSKNQTTTVKCDMSLSGFSIAGIVVGSIIFCCCCCIIMWVFELLHCLFKILCCCCRE